MNFRNAVCLAFVFAIFVSSLCIVSATEFEAEPPFIKGVVTLGGNLSYSISLFSPKSERNFVINEEDKKGIISIDSNNVKAGKNGWTSFGVTLGSKTIESGVHIGRIEVSDGKEKLKMPVILEVETAKPLFDSAIELLKPSSSLSKKENLLLNINVYNLRAKNNLNVVMKYELRDLEGKVFLSESQELNVKSKTQVSKSFPLENYTTGDYVLSISTVQENSVGVSSLLFSVSDKEPLPVSKGGAEDYVYYVAIGMIVSLIIAFLIANHYWRKKIISVSEEFEKKAGTIKGIRFRDVAKKISELEYKRSLLEIAYKNRYIKKTTFDEDNANINRMVSELKKRLQRGEKED